MEQWKVFAQSVKLLSTCWDFLPACQHQKKILMTALMSKYRFDKSGV